MTIQECYQRLGGDYSAAETRLVRESLVRKFIAKFLEDDSYAQLQRAMEEGHREQAFRAAHTLKGVCGNLSLDRLCHSTSRMTELLRLETETIPEGADALFEEVRRDYELTVSAIRAYLEQSETAQ